MKGGSMQHTSRFLSFVEDFTALVTEAGESETKIMQAGPALLAGLVERDDWLPMEFAKPHPTYYQQYLLHCDPQGRFTVVSFVWGPNQKTPVHDHTVWGLIGMLRGAERSVRYSLGDPGEPMHKLGEDILQAGCIDCVSPSLGDIHEVSNVYPDKVSISIHVYGGNIGKIERHVFDQATGAVKKFVSGYAGIATIPEGAWCSGPRDG